MYEIIHRLESTTVVLLGTHNIVEQQVAGVPTEMAEFYEIFRVNDEGTLLTLLPTTMPWRILDMAFRFGQDPAENALKQNTGNVTRDADQVVVMELPIGSVGYPDKTYDYDTITRRSRRHRCEGL